jgi:amidase
MSSDLDFASAIEAAAAIRTGRVSSRELTERAFKRIDHFDPALHAFSYLLREEALEQAARADAQRAGGTVLGPLHGAPVHVKEAFAVAGQPGTWGLETLTGSRAAKNATVTQHLLDAGAVLIGATNVALLLADHQSFNPLYGTSSNPYDLSRTSGGSSGGSAAALAAGLGYLGVGSDIGGSIRVPAHYCGIFGHKPTLDLVSLAGHQPGGGIADHRVASMLGVAGPMARSAEDLALALEVIGGPDGPDARAIGWRMPAPRHKRLADFRVGVKLDGFGTPLSSDVGPVLERALAAMAHAGVLVHHGWPAELDPLLQEQTYFRLLGAFLYGEVPPDKRGPDAPQFHVAADLMAEGALASFADVQHWNRMRFAFRAIWQRYFRDIDVMLMPVTFTPAFPHDQETEQSQRVIMTPEVPRPYAAQFDWIPSATLSGCPASVVPVGVTATGLPIGVQVMGPMWEDATPLAFAGLLARELGGVVTPEDYDL